jgi:hypothetical protein
MRKTWNSIITVMMALALAGLTNTGDASATDMAHHHGKHHATTTHASILPQHKKQMAQHSAMMMKMHGGKMDHAAMMKMHARHHGRDGKMTAAHRQHMAAMMKMHGGKSLKMDHAMMMKMHAIHGVKMGGSKIHGMGMQVKGRSAAKPVKMAMAQRPGSCGPFMYRKAGACLDARAKK